MQPELISFTENQNIINQLVRAAKKKGYEKCPINFRWRFNHLPEYHENNLITRKAKLFIIYKLML